MIERFEHTDNRQSWWIVEVYSKQKISESKGTFRELSVIEWNITVVFDGERSHNLLLTHA